MTPSKSAKKDPRHGLVVGTFSKNFLPPLIIPYRLFLKDENFPLIFRWNNGSRIIRECLQSIFQNEFLGPFRENSQGTSPKTYKISKSSININRWKYNFVHISRCWILLKFGDRRCSLWRRCTVVIVRSSAGCARMSWDGQRLAQPQQPCGAVAFRTKSVVGG